MSEPATMVGGKNSTRHEGKNHEGIQTQIRTDAHFGSHFIFLAKKEQELEKMKLQPDQPNTDLFGLETLCSVYRSENTMCTVKHGGGRITVIRGSSHCGNGL